MAHYFSLQVYYEDTDLAGVVYYANYLKFIERARSTLIAECGIDQLQMQANGLLFVVRRLKADYLAPARLGDLLLVVTKVHYLTAVRIIFSQDIFLGKKKLFTSYITVVCINNCGILMRMEKSIIDKLV